MLDFDQRGRKREKKKEEEEEKRRKKRESREKGRDSGKETRGRIGRDREGVYGGGAKPVSSSSRIYAGEATLQFTNRQKRHRNRARSYR